MMMKKYLLTFFTIVLWTSCSTTKQPSGTATTKEKIDVQEKNPELEVYRATYTRYTDLIHTKLEIKPDWNKKFVYGKATINLHQHFYPSDSVCLNARGMSIQKVSIQNSDNTKKDLAYTYSDDLLCIRLDRVYSKNDVFSIYIEYTAKPDELKTGGSAAINSDKGFYFINADGKNPDKPRQFWTQGETQSNSVWFPTIESPDQKMTQEIYLTVDSAYQTLSNGLLLSTTYNGDGTKTDYWKQSLPAAPYLTMIAAGDYAVVKDKWRNIEVSYYLDKPYEKYAKMIFGKTPEMIEFFSNKLKVDFPWEKYSQIVVHDYVSGAMENTTAVVHGVNMQQDSREYLDGNYEDYISHELFHHWFGDLVTCESWSNLTLNEGFANYSEYLWREYKYGRDDADRSNQSEQTGYLLSTTKNDPALIRFNYEDREDMYDAISYNKGGRVLHMLRKYVGDDAFFAALKLYLDSHRFSSVEVHDLRMAFEKITGEDLNWFFNQWFLSPGRPAITIQYNWDEVALQQSITIEQTQELDKNPLYRIPLDVDFYYQGKVERTRIVIDSARQEFTFTVPSRPDLVNVDAEKMLLCTKKDKKEKSAFLFQFYHAPLYLDRFEALVKLADGYRTGTPEAQVVLDALKDPSWKIRLTALDNIDELAKNMGDSLLPVILHLAQHDSISDVREASYKILGKYYKYHDLEKEIEAGLKDSSYQVNARAFKIISDKDPDKAFKVAVELEADSSSDIFMELTSFYAAHPNKNHIPYFTKALRKSRGWYNYQILNNFGKYLSTQDDPILSEGISFLENFASYSSRKRQLNAINNCYKAILADIKSRIDKKEEELQAAEKNNSPLLNKVEIEKSLRDLKALKSKVSESQDKLDDASGK